MRKTALMFGSIGSVAETSDIQRRAYNRALSEAGLDWDWNDSIYAELLAQSGGKDRLAMLAAATGTPLSSDRIDAIHTRKTELACEEVRLGESGVRPGVIALINVARKRGLRLGFVTSTYRPNIDAILEMTGAGLAADDFDIIVSRADVDAGKPAPDAYIHALKALDIEPGLALAVEDTALSVMSAHRARIATVATPGKLTAGQDFWQADLLIDNLAGASDGVDERVLALLEG